MPKVNAITQHALDRYCERTGAKNIAKALSKIDCATQFLLRIDKNRYYSKTTGFVLVIRKGVLKTIYKPYPRDFSLIHEAIAKETQMAL